MLEDDNCEKDLNDLKFILYKKGEHPSPNKIKVSLGNKRRNLFKTHIEKELLGVDKIKYGFYGLSTTLNMNIETACKIKEINNE